MYQARIKGRSVRHQLRGVDYHVTEWGERHSRLVVFLHGWGDAGSTFQFVIDELKQDWFVIAPDWRGFGESRIDAESYWFPDYLADLDAILQIYSPDAAVRLVGHSMGANVATLYAGVMPERVSALVNVEGFGLANSDPADAPGRYRKWIEAGRSRPRLCEKSLEFAVNGTAHHIGNESSATKTPGPTLVTCQSKCSLHLPPVLVILRFHTASADSYQLRVLCGTRAENPATQPRAW